MKKLALAAISFAIAGSASAADLRMPVKAPAPAPVAAFSWTGCYVGAGGGYGMWKQEANYFNPTPVGSVDVGGDGWFGTVQVGCDYQVSPSIVIGAFGDWDFGSIKGDFSHPFLGGFKAEEKLKNSWAAGGRIGWVPWSTTQFMVFVSGGWTQARFGQGDFVVINTGVPVGISLAKHNYSGWFLGTGYEYGLGFLPGLFWKTEYRYADYGSERVNVILTATGAPRGDYFENDKRVHTVRSELVWRFNWGGPVVARY